MEAVAAIPPFERFYDERQDEIFGYLAPPARARGGRGRVPGDVPARTARLREARARRAPAGLGASRSPRGVAVDVRRKADAGRRARRAAGRRRAARLRGARSTLPDELPPTERAAVVLRYGYDLSYDDIAPRSARAPRRPARRPRPACGACAGRRPHDHRPRRSRPPLPRRRGLGRARSTSRYDFTDSPVGRLLVAATRARRLPRSRSTPSPSEQLERARAHLRPAGPPLAAPGRRRPPRARRVLRGRPRASSTSPLDLHAPARVPAVGAGGARPRAVRRRRHLRRRSRSAIGKPRAARAVGGALNRNPIPIVLPVPPRRRRERQPRRLRRRPRAQAGAPRARGRAPRLGPASPVRAWIRRSSSRRSSSPVSRPAFRG